MGANGDIRNAWRLRYVLRPIEPTRSRAQVCPLVSWQMTKTVAFDDLEVKSRNANGKQDCTCLSMGRV